MRSSVRTLGCASGLPVLRVRSLLSSCPEGRGVWTASFLQPLAVCQEQHNPVKIKEDAGNWPGFGGLGSAALRAAFSGPSAPWLALISPVRSAAFLTAHAAVPMLRNVLLLSSNVESPEPAGTGGDGEGPEAAVGDG